MVPAANPATGGWREQQPLELRSDILACARDAFFENGYHGTAVRDIARRVGVTVPAIYYHYENKEALLVALLDTSIERVNDLCLEALDEAGDDVALRFSNLVECLVLYMTNSTKLAHLDGELHALTPEHREMLVGKRRRIEDYVLAAIQAGVDAGLFTVTSPRVCARALLGMIQSVTVWFRPTGSMTGQQVAREYLDIALQMVGHRPR